MDPICSGKVTTALNLLAEEAEQHWDDIQVHPTEGQKKSDEENDSRSPVFDSFYNEGGSAAIISLKNFTSDNY